MKQLYFLLGVLLALTACQAGSPVPEGTETPSAAPTAAESTETPAIDPAAADNTATPGSYPARPDAASPESGSPSEPEESEPPAGYPAGEAEAVWVVRPLGEQCADESTFAYASLQEAVSALEEEGVNVLASEDVDLPVCQACGCPTSEHYRVQISGEDVQAAQSLGWSTE